MQAGIPLQVILEDEDIQNVQYRWYIDDERISDIVGGSYIPTEKDYEHWIKVEVLSGDEVIGSDKVYFSKLPVVYINTVDGESITSKEEYKDGNMYIQGNEAYDSQYDGEIEIKGRGNTSWSYPQKPYKLKLDKSADLFGFGKNKHWVLLSPYLDQSLMRNKIAYDLSGELGLVQMQFTWVDVVLNGEYAGNYGLCEHIRVGDSRIPIFNWGDEIEDVAKAIYKAEDKLTEDDRDVLAEELEKDLSWITSGEFTYNGTIYTISDYYQVNNDISGGYIFEMSEEYDEVSRFTTDNGLKVMLDTPEYLNTNEEMFGYVEDYWQQFEDGIRSLDGYNGEGKHYQELADFDSMVAYWLTMEIMGNNDAWYKSRYAYKDLGGLLAFGPAWDFDWGVGSIAVSTTATGWKLSHGTIWKDFIDDPNFCIKATEKYWSIRDYLEELIRDGGMIDSYRIYLSESGHATDEKYPSTTYHVYERRSFDSDVQALKTYLAERITWLDEQFASTSSIVASLYKTQSTNPYTRSEEELSISLPNTVEDTISDHLKADGILEGKDYVDVEIAVKDENTTSLNIYVNGYKYVEDIAVMDGKVSVNIDASVLNAGAGTLNVISLIGKDANGEVTYTNFEILETALEQDVYREGISQDEIDAVVKSIEDAIKQLQKKEADTGNTPSDDSDSESDDTGNPSGGSGIENSDGDKVSDDKTDDATDNITDTNPTGNTGNPTGTGDEQTTTNTPAAKGTILSVIAEQCTVVVTSADAANPSVAYKGTTDKKASKVTIPDSVTVDGVTYKVTSIADNAFARNKKITKVIIGKNVISIGKNAFRNCSKLKIVIVQSTILNRIGANAFRGDKKLSKITLKTTRLTKKSIGKNVLKGTNKKLVVKVPKRMVSKYKAYLKGKGNKTIRVK